MPEEGFLRRWARVKASGGDEVAEAPRPAAPVVPVSPAAPGAVGRSGLPAAQADEAGQGHEAGQAGEAGQAPGRPAPTLEDAARLTPHSDFSAFVGQGVDKDVRRLALKKLFADPHFNVMDRLDMYMDDYNKPDPVSATMLAALSHARGVLRRPEEVQAELARLAARDAPADAVADVVADSALPAFEGELAEVPGGAGKAIVAEAAPGQDADEPTPAASVPDTLVHFAPNAGPSIVLPPARTLPAHATGQAGDTIALHGPRAQNAEASP
jgi:hypothetical protein